MYMWSTYPGSNHKRNMKSVMPSFKDIVLGADDDDDKSFNYLLMVQK